MTVKQLTLYPISNQICIFPEHCSSIMHQSILAPPIPQATAGHLGALSVPGGGGAFANFVQYCQPQGHPWAFAMHMVSYRNITKHGGFTGYTSLLRDWPTCQRWEKLVEVLNACSHNFMHALPHCLSRQSLHNKIWNYQPQSTYFFWGGGWGVIESTSCLSRIWIKFIGDDSDTTIIYQIFEELHFIFF